MLVHLQVRLMCGAGVAILCSGEYRCGVGGARPLLVGIREGAALLGPGLGVHGQGEHGMGVAKRGRIDVPSSEVEGIGSHA